MAEDWIPDSELLQRFFSREASELENRKIVLWLSDPKNQAAVEEIMKNRWEDTEGLNSVNIEFNSDDYWPDMLKKISEAKNISKKDGYIVHGLNDQDSSGKKVWSVVKFAAALAVFMVASFLFFYFHVTNSNTELVAETKAYPIEKISPPGKRTSIELVDGTIVTLNQNSRLLYFSDFNETDRRVEVIGEAFFQIKSNAEKPFIVKTNDVYSTALGTSFNVRNITGDKEISISLTEGSIVVSFDQPKSVASIKSKLLSPGEEAICTIDSKIMHTQDFDVKKVTGWKDNILYFKDMNAYEVAKVIEDWYEVKVVFKNSPSSDWIFSGEFHNETLKNVLEGLKFSKGIRYTIDKKTIHIVFN
ncbi:MAG: FecR family protein [Cyclobacteriaceae bacterium]|nr:FecR family protein [Cyclobacteriaceae bacterium]